MRRFILVATLAGLTPVSLAFAQGQAPAPVPAPQPAPAMAAPNPGNCGTPDDPKPCGSVQRHATRHHAKKQTTS
jgi:hypothetical protein